MALENTPMEPMRGLSQTFEFGKHTFVSGLFWQPLPGASNRDRKAELRQMAEEQGFDLCVQRTSGTPQAGFGAASDGLKAGMLSVAAMVSKSLEVANRDRSFLCAMQVPDGRWIYVAQRDGVLLHDGDVLGDEASIHSRMMTDLSLAEWQTVFAPDAWGFADSVERHLEDLLPRHNDQISIKKWWELRPIHSRSLDFTAINPKFLLLLLIPALLVGGYYFWDQYRLKKELEELARQEAELAAQREVAVAEQPWKKEAPAAYFVAACDSALSQVKTFWPGNWTPVDVVCADRSLVINWVRQNDGWVDQIRKLEPQAEVAIDGNRATLSLPLELPGGQDDTLPVEKDRRLNLLDFAQRYNFQLNLKNPTNPVLGQPQMADPGWKALEWTLTDLPLAPATILPEFNGPGLRIKQMHLTFSGSTMKWTLEGMQYVQP